MCDIRFASENARFSEGYIRLGLVPGDGGAYFLPRMVGISKALELLWTGDFISANVREKNTPFHRKLMHQLKFVVQVLKIGVDGSLWYVNDGTTLANMQGFPSGIDHFFEK